jgi:hypothetical protein
VGQVAEMVEVEVDLVEVVLVEALEVAEVALVEAVKVQVEALDLPHA